MKAIFAGLIAALLVIGGASLARGGDTHDYPEARLYDASIDAGAAVNAAMERAKERRVNVLIAFGANWCHDSRAFAGWTQSERIGRLIKDRYELVFVNVGMPQQGDGHNLDVLQRFGIEEQEGTPLVLVVSPEGDVLNADTAQSWRNTASRSEDEIYDELVILAELQSGGNSEQSKIVQQIWTRSKGQSCEYAAGENGPWLQEVKDLGKIGPSTRPAEISDETPWRCVATVIYAIQSAGGPAGYISNPTNP
ncbi:hypothetical protein EH31_16405 [Erythrobacter longus]|uniref:Thioredoxin domain-containing protein n=1 Tax=Erythrobacter longus TaxID=1044 RepID=A0A074M753_ERYLO|nr:hypothetical protein EH31_16405 [Erythrobacter longus]